MSDASPSSPSLFGRALSWSTMLGGELMSLPVDGDSGLTAVQHTESPVDEHDALDSYLSQQFSDALAVPFPSVSMPFRKSSLSGDSPSPFIVKEFDDITGSCPYLKTPDVSSFTFPMSTDIYPSLLSSDSAFADGIEVPPLPPSVTPTTSSSTTSTKRSPRSRSPRPSPNALTKPPTSRGSKPRSDPTPSPGRPGIARQREEFDQELPLREPGFDRSTFAVHRYQDPDNALIASSRPRYALSSAVSDMSSLLTCGSRMFHCVYTRQDVDASNVRVGFGFSGQKRNLPTNWHGFCNYIHRNSCMPTQWFPVSTPLYNMVFALNVSQLRLCADCNVTSFDIVLDVLVQKGGSSSSRPVLDPALSRIQLDAAALERVRSSRVKIADDAFQHPFVSVTADGESSVVASIVHDRELNVDIPRALIRLQSTSHFSVHNNKDYVQPLSAAFFLVDTSPLAIGRTPEENVLAAFVTPYVIFRSSNPTDRRVQKQRTSKLKRKDDHQAHADDSINED